jgi:hypothetical protein
MKEKETLYISVAGEQILLDELLNSIEVSVFYPACGLDDLDLMAGKSEFSMYVRADERVSAEEAIAFLSNPGLLPEYEQEQIVRFEGKQLLDEDIFSDSPRFPLKPTEVQHLVTRKEQSSFGSADFFVAVYRLKPDFRDLMYFNPFQQKETALKDHLVVMFFCEDAMKLFYSLYFHYKKSPWAVVLEDILHHQPYWTKLSAPDYRFRVSLLINKLYNAAALPSFLITAAEAEPNAEKLVKHQWDDYILLETPKSCEAMKAAVYERNVLFI